MPSLQTHQHVHDDTAGTDTAQVDPRHPEDRGDRDDRCGENDGFRHVRSRRIVEKRRRAARGGRATEVHARTPPALVAMAPEKPATNDVHPGAECRLRPITPRAGTRFTACYAGERRQFHVHHRPRRRQTRGRPACDGSGALRHRRRQPRWREEVPPPITFETMIAAASSRPRRRSSRGSGNGCCGEAHRGTYWVSNWRSIDIRRALPRSGAMLAVDLDLGVDGFAVLRHLDARLRPVCPRFERRTISLVLPPGARSAVRLL